MPGGDKRDPRFVAEVCLLRAHEVRETNPGEARRQFERAVAQVGAQEVDRMAEECVIELPLYEPTAGNTRCLAPAGWYH